MNKRNFSILLSLLLALPFWAGAEVKLPPLFADNMVLQQQSDVAIWGWAEQKAEVSVTTSWNEKNYTTKADKNGKWKLKVSTPAFGGPYEITISDGTEVTLKNVMIGEVWLCAGQSNMEMPMKGFPGQPVCGSKMDIVKSKNSNIRMISVKRAYSIEPQDNFEGEWLEASPSTTGNFSATAYYFGRLLNEVMDVPIGLVEVSWGGSCIQSWMSRETSVPYEDTPLPEEADKYKNPNRIPTMIFNGMLNPVIGYGIKGSIWYQGETNFFEPDAYEQHLQTMVNEWRTRWEQGDFPFYYMQIAPFDYTRYNNPDPKSNSAFVRDAQRKAMDQIPNSGMAVTLDLGQFDNIHPARKKEGGERLALWALGATYGYEGFGYKSPSYNALEIKGSTVVVSFNDVPNGLTSYDKEVTLFEIAGENKRFYPATCHLRRKSVVLSSPHVEKPVAVRYAFKDFVVGELFGTDGLPVSSFRTDDWEK